LVEGSDEYKALSLSIENGDSKTAKHMLSAINELLNGNNNEAYREAHNAIRSSEGGDTGGDDSAVCPFCGGDGVLEFKHAPTVDGYQDPADAVDAEASCKACKGKGNMTAIELFDNYAGDSYPEHVVMSLIRGNMAEAKSLASAVVSEIRSHEDDNFEKSTEGVGE